MEESRTTLTADDERQIKKLLVRYTYFVDVDSLSPRDDFLALFAEDAVVSSPSLGRFVGRGGLEAFADRVADATRGSWWRHWISNVWITGSGERASMTAFVLVYVTRQGHPRTAKLVLTGHYQCDVARVDGTWELGSRIEFADALPE